MPPSKDYEKFNRQAGGDVSRASFAAQSLDKTKNHTKVRIKESCIERLIPSNSQIEIEQVPFHNLKFGDFMLIRDKKEIVIRRFISYEVRGTSEIVVHAVNQHWKTREEFHDSQVSGRILMVESGGKSFNPRKVESLGERFNNRLTFFGTSSPWKRFLSSAGLIGSMLKPPKM